MFSYWFQQLGAGSALSDETKLRFIPVENPSEFTCFQYGEMGHVRSPRQRWKCLQGHALILGRLGDGAL